MMPGHDGGADPFGRKILLVLIILGCLLIGAIFGSHAADDKIQFNFENTTDSTKIVELNKMDQPCYMDNWGNVKCYHNRMTAEMRPDDYSAKNDTRVEKEVGDRFCVEWTNLSSNPYKFKGVFCVVVEEKTFEVNATPEGLEVIEVE